MTKKLICILLAALTVLSLAACQAAPQATPTPAPATPAPTESAPPAVAAPTPEPAPEHTATPAPVTPAPQLPTPLTTSVPAPTEKPSTAPSITKSPTSENRKAGEQAVFIANANGWSKLSWRAMSPNGLEISLRDFQQNFPTCTIDGADDTRLAIGNLSLEMDGWGFTCVFDNNGVTARSETAYLHVAPGAGTQNPAETADPEQTDETAPDEPAPRLQYICPICGAYYDGSFCNNCGYSPYDHDPYSGTYDGGMAGDPTGGYYPYDGYDIYA